MSNQLVISAIAPNRAGIAHEITALVTQCGCNILEGKMQTLGETFSMVFMAEGEWNALAKLEHMLPSKACSMGMTTMMLRTKQANPTTELPYRVKITTLDNPGLTKAITSFFSENNINIQEMSCKTYPSQQTGAQIGSIKLTVSIPKPTNVSKLKEKFNLFCAEMNLDGLMEAFD